MTAERCGLGSLLPMSCRGRAEAFARSLQTKLRSLGRTNDDDTTAADGPSTSVHDEESAGGGWIPPQSSSDLSDHQQPVVVSSPESDRFFDFDMEESSPGSPANEEVGVNMSDGLRCESGCVLASPSSAADVDSDSSDGQYFDPAWSDVIADAFGSLVPPSKIVSNVSSSDTFSVSSPSQDSLIMDQNGNTTTDSNELNNDDADSSTDVITPTDECNDIESELVEIQLDSNEGELVSSLYHIDDQHDAPEVNGVTSEENGVASCIISKSSEDASPPSPPPPPITVLVSQPSEDFSEPEKIPSPQSDTEVVSSQKGDESFYSHDVPQDLYDKISIETDFEIRQCVEKLCSEIISRAEYEASTHQTNEDQPISPRVIISRVESLEKSQSKESSPFDFLCTNKEDNLSTPEDDKPRRVQRSSSLKTGKTPPGTPGRKKIVRFADVLGLDLADVRTFMDEIPKVPSCAFWDLNDDASGDSRSRGETEASPDPPVPTRCLIPMFPQPGGAVDFFERVRDQKVCLENAFQGDSLSISGTVRVLNIDFHKSLYVRYSLDGWNNFADLQATFVPSSSDGFSDKFSFVLYAHTLEVGQRVEFAIRYTAGGQQYWDSNNGGNYIFQCMNSTTTQSEYLNPQTATNVEDEWASFY